MKVKKVLAGGLAAAAAGATLAFGALAASANLGAYVQVSDSTLSSPVIVVGTQTASITAEYPNDILGAADIAAAVAGYATTPVTVGGGTTVSVSDGVDVATTNTKLYLGDVLTKSGVRTTVTKTDLPTLLAQGTFVDGAGTSYVYNQYINFGYGLVSYGTSGGDLTDPALYIDTGTSTATPLYNMTVVFNKVLNLSNTDVRGQAITLFGRSYTIGSASIYDSTGTKLVLFGGAGNTQTVSEGQEADMSVGGVSHKVKVIGVSSSTQAVISIDGTSKEVIEGNTYTIAGVDVYVESVYFFTKETQVSQVKLSLGSSKITLENGATVKTGQAEDTIDGTLVTLTGSLGQGISKLDVSVTAKDSSHDSITEGQSYTDPVFGGVKLAFGGLNKGATDTITIDNAGNTKAVVKFTDYRGNEKQIEWVEAPASGTFLPTLNYTTASAYQVIEGATVNRNDIVLLAPSQESEFGHIMQYSSQSSIGASGAYIELKDVMSADTTRIYLNDPGFASATFYVDGQQYYVKNVTSSAYTFQFTWGSGASAGTAGNYTAFPLIKAKNGEYITFVKNTSMGSTAGLYYQLPGDTNYHLITNATSSVTAGRIDYTFTPGVTFATLIAINKTASTGVTLSAAPAFLLYEEKGKDNNADTEVKDAVFVTVADGSGSNTDVTVSSPVFTAAVSSSASLQSDNSVTIYGDRYGTAIAYDTDGQGLVTISYPDDQATAMVGIGSDPKFSTSGQGGTYNSAVKLKNPVSKFDTEMSTSAVNSDLILIGGPCANSLVTTLLQTESTTCSTDTSGFINKYPNGMIKEFENAFGSGKKALVVAGVNGAQTRSLAAKVMQGTMTWS